MSDSSSNTTPPESALVVRDNRLTLDSEINELIKTVVESVGNHSHLSYEVDSYERKINTLTIAAHSSQTFANKIEGDKLILAKKTKELEEEMDKVTAGIVSLASKYQALYAVDIQQVRDNLESGMEKFSHILSTDTLERIQKESDSIHSHVKDLLDNQLTNFNKTFTESKNVQHQLQTKIDTLADSLRQQTARLEEVSRSEAATTNNKALEEKLEEIEKKMQEQCPYLIGMLDGLTNRADQQTTAMGTVASVISDTIKEDRSKSAKRMQQMTSDINSNQMAITDIKNETTVLKKTISEYQISMGAALVKQQSKLSTLDSIVDRMDQVEKNVSYLKSKLEAMEPIHQLALKEIKNSITTGDKRPHDIMIGNGSSDGDSGSTSQIQQLDFKLTNLVQYMHQFKSTVLNPSFPRKLDDTLQDMEACLQNHEMFIAYLVDPVAAAKTYSNTTLPTPPPPSSSSSSSSSSSTHKDVSPALLTTIHRLVTAESEKKPSITPDLVAYMNRLVSEQTEPLKKKIEVLEARLAKR